MTLDTGMEAIDGQVRDDAVVEGLDQPGALAPRDVTEPLPIDIPVEVAERSVDEDDGGASFAKASCDPLERRVGLAGGAVMVHLVVDSELDDDHARPVGERVGPQALEGAGGSVPRDAGIPDRDGERDPEPVSERRVGRHAIT